MNVFLTKTTLSVTLTRASSPKGGALVLLVKYSTKPRPSGEVAVRSTDGEGQKSYTL